MAALLLGGVLGRFNKAAAGVTFLQNEIRLQRKYYQFQENK